MPLTISTQSNLWNIPLNQSIKTNIVFLPFILFGYCISDVSKLMVFKDKKGVLLNNLKKMLKIN